MGKKSIKTFKPNSELLHFAETFAKNYKVLPEGHYYSNGKKYHILYKVCLTDNYEGFELKTPARVGLTSGVFEISKTKILAHDNYDFVVSLVIWCAIEFNALNIMVSDKILFDFYKSTGRSFDEAFICWIDVFKQSPSELNVRRMKQLTELRLEK
jgi:hypothetical protein